MTPDDMAAVHRAAMISTRPWHGAEIATLLARTGTFQITGPQSFAIGRVILDEAELLTLATHPAAQRQGQGRAVLAEFHREAGQRGAARAFLEVSADNLPARTLYGAMGYIQAGRRRDYYHSADGTITDALILRRALSAI